jgi:hypothetical protein
MTEAMLRAAKIAKTLFVHRPHDEYDLEHPDIDSESAPVLPPDPAAPLEPAFTPEEQAELDVAWKEWSDAKHAPQRQRDALIDLVHWALGEHPTDHFPTLPDDWPKRKFYWRKELRARLDAILAWVQPPDAATTVGHATPDLSSFDPTTFAPPAERVDRET